MIADWINEVQRDLFQSLIEQMYRLEDENKRLREKTTATNSSAGAGGMSQEETLRRIKHEIFGDPLVPTDEER